MAKYLDVKNYLERFSAYPDDSKVTFMMLRDSLNKADEADVIPVSFVKKWFREHYHTDSCALADDYKRMAT